MVLTRATSTFMCVCVCVVCVVCVQAGADVNAADYDLRTPLHIAASEGNAAAAALLVANGADAEAKDRWGHSAKDDAQEKGHGEVVSVLQ